MAKLVFEIAPEGERWIVRHTGDFGEGVRDSIPYVTKEAAFEAAASSIANAISKGHGIQLTIAGGEGRWS